MAPNLPPTRHVLPPQQLRPRCPAFYPPPTLYVLLEQAPLSSPLFTSAFYVLPKQAPLSSPADDIHGQLRYTVEVVDLQINAEAEAAQVRNVNVMGCKGIEKKWNISWSSYTVEGVDLQINAEAEAAQVRISCVHAVLKWKVEWNSLHSGGCGPANRRGGRGGAGVSCTLAGPACIAPLH